ncbi:MAG TPA: rhomboid family intramembrane serine protease [Burkholderiales bacterium]|jgi:membrane associated rhomboid family serine protease|nr:rhomboid family intramembrane serine protease [Burkholderiales bacterium]
MRPLPPFTQWLIIANGVLYLLQQAVGNALVYWFALWPGEGSGIASLPLFTPWTLVTYSFLHGNFMHIAFNMLAVWMFGADLERVWGAKRTAAAYFASVVTGGIAQIIVGAMFGEGGGPVIGASAGVFGILLAYALVFPNRKIMPLFPPIPMPARVFVLIYASLELVFGITGTVSGVAHFAHLGGLVGGFLVYKYWRQRPRGGWGPRY